MYYQNMYFKGGARMFIENIVILEHHLTQRTNCYILNGLMLYVKGFPRLLRLPAKNIKQQIYYFANWKPLPNVIVFLYNQLDSTAVLHMHPPTQPITTNIVMTT